MRYGYDMEWWMDITIARTRRTGEWAKSEGEYIVKWMVYIDRNSLFL